MNSIGEKERVPGDVRGQPLRANRGPRGAGGGWTTTRSKSPSTYPPLLFIVPNFHSLRTRRWLAIQKREEPRRGHTDVGIRFVAKGWTTPIFLSNSRIGRTWRIFLIPYFQFREFFQFGGCFHFFPSLDDLENLKLMTFVLFSKFLFNLVAILFTITRIRWEWWISGVDYFTEDSDTISKRKLFDSTTRLTTTVLFGARSGLYNPYIQRKGKMEGFLYSRTPWTKSVSSHVRPNPARGTQFPRARGTHSLHPGRGGEKAKKIERLRFDSRTVRFP